MKTGTLMAKSRQDGHEITVTRFLPPLDGVRIRHVGGREMVSISEALLMSEKRRLVKSLYSDIKSFKEWYYGEGLFCQRLRHVTHRVQDGEVCIRETYTQYCFTQRTNSSYSFHGKEALTRQGGRQYGNIGQSNICVFRYSR